MPCTELLSMSLKALALLGLAAVMAACAAPQASDAEAQGSTVSRDKGCAGTTVTEGELAGMLRKAGFAESDVGPMVCIANKESSFCSTASNGTHDGLYQIDPSLHLGKDGCPSSREELGDPQANVSCAKAVFDEAAARGNGFQPWTTKGECMDATAPASSDPPASDSTVSPGTGTSTTPTDGTPVGDRPPSDLPPSGDLPPSSTPGDTSCFGTPSFPYCGYWFF